jgi:hypothetical protein
MQALTLEKTIQISIAMETATKDAMELKGKQHESTVLKVKMNRPKPKVDKPALSVQCYRCNRPGHKPNDCGFKEATCHKYKKGHIKSACRTKDINHRRKIHSVRTEDNSDTYDSNYVGIYTLFSDQEDNKNSIDAGIYKVKSDDYKEIFVTVEMDGKSVKMEVDTGSAIFVIPKKKFDEIFLKRKLKSTDIILRTFSGEKLTPMGVTYVQVKHNNQMERLPLYVVQKEGAILFGRAWLRKKRLDWTSF